MNKLEKLINEVLLEKKLYKKGFVNEETSTMMKLINTAERDGYLEKHEGSANYITDAAKKVAEKWDKLNNEEKKIYRDDFYQKFLKLIGKRFRKTL